MDDLLSNARTTLDLVRALNQLRVDCGWPSLNTLAGSTNIPRSTLHDYLREGGSLLPLDKLNQVLQAIQPDCNLAPWTKAWSRIVAGRHNSVGGTGIRPVPRDLPIASHPFVGRADILAKLDKPFEYPGPGRPVLSVLTGGGGTGKTATAVHWAHSRAERFADGQLYVDLAGFGAGEPLSPDEVLKLFLCCLGEAPGSVPAGLSERAARFRNLTYQLRLLLLCDNAATTEQLEPLLPNGPGCYVLVTTRHDFHGFSARHGAWRTVVPPLARAEATELAARLLGDKAAAEPEAVAEFAERCARLPLAIRLAAERFADTEAEGLAEQVASVNAKDALRPDPADSRGDLTAIFNQTLLALDSDTQDLFTAIGMHPGRRFQLGDLAALTDSPTADIDRRIAALIRAHMIDEIDADVYSAHDLLRSHATGRARNLPADRIAAARNRLADYYVHSLARAKDAEHPWNAPKTPRQLPGAGFGARTFTDGAEATAWVQFAMPNLTAAVTEWAERGMATHVGWVSTTLWLWLNLHCQFDEAQHIHGAFVTAAEAVGDDAMLATAEFRLGDVYWRIGDYPAAERWFRRARIHKQRTGHKAGVVHCLSGLGTVLLVTDRLDEAEAVFEESRKLAAAIDAGESEAIARYNLGEVALRRRDWNIAAHRLERAVELAELIDARDTLVASWSGLAQAYARLGRFAESDRLIELSHSAAADLDSPELRADVSFSLGMAYLALKRPEAVGHLRRALRQFQELGLVPHATWASEALAEIGYR